MASVKATFTLDEETVRDLALESDRTGRSKSAVVREAIREHRARADRLSEAERLRMLRAIDELASKVPERTQAEVDAEISEIREARRSGGRRTPIDRG